MQNQGVSASTRRCKLHFFPASFSEETLLSRVSRYQLLAGTCKDEHTFRLLFRQRGQEIDFTESAPPCLKFLATHLPGKPSAELGKLLCENTFVPFKASITQSPFKHFPSPFSDNMACVHCLAEDAALSGIPYLHRSHHLPNVNACWKHGTQLIFSCPECKKPFRTRATFLAAPIVPCSCGWYLTCSKSATEVPRWAHDFAIHAHRVLMERVQGTTMAAAVRYFRLNIEPFLCIVEPQGRAGRTLSVDPGKRKFPDLTTWTFASNEAKVTTPETRLELWTIPSWRYTKKDG